jgi:hypothetical protein
MHIFSCRLGSVLALAAGLLVLYLTFWAAYVVIFICQDGVSAITDLCFNYKFHISHFWRLVLSGLFIAVLFFEWFRRCNLEPGDYSGVSSPAGSRAFVFYGGMGGALAMLLANPQASSTLIAEILYTGPRLIMAAVSMAREAFTHNFDVEGCSQVLQLAMSKINAVTYEELNTTKSEFEQTKLHNDLAQISGVVFLEKGVRLTDDLRGELHGLMLQG